MRIRPGYITNREAKYLTEQAEYTEDFANGFETVQWDLGADSGYGNVDDKHFFCWAVLTSGPDANGKYAWSEIQWSYSSPKVRNYSVVTGGLSGTQSIFPAFERNENTTPSGKVVRLERMYYTPTHEWVFVFDYEGGAAGDLTGDTITWDSVTLNVNDSFLNLTNTNTNTTNSVDTHTNTNTTYNSGQIFYQGTHNSTWNSSGTFQFTDGSIAFGTSTNTSTPPSGQLLVPILNTTGSPNWTHESGNIVFNQPDGTLWLDDGTSFLPIISNASGSETQTSTTFNDYDLDGVSIIYSTGSGGNTWTGFNDPFPGKEVLLVNLTGTDETVSHQTGSTATNQITTPSGSSITVPNKKTLRFIYDGTTQKYIVVGGTALGGGFDLITESGGSSVTIDASGGTKILGGLQVGEATDTTANVVQILDGGADKPGQLQLYSGDGEDWFLWVDSNGDIRINGTAPADEDADGVVVNAVGAGADTFTVYKTECESGVLVRYARTVTVTLASDGPALAEGAWALEAYLGGCALPFDTVTTCSELAEVAEYWTVENPNVTNGSCSECTTTWNGTNVLSYLSGCVWAKSVGDGTYCSFGTQAQIILNFSGSAGVEVRLEFFNGDLDNEQLYEMDIEDFNPFGANTLTRNGTAASGLCASWPATLTITPATGP